MRNLPRRKLILSTAIAGLIAIPAVFAHGHHNSTAYATASSRHSGFTHNDFSSVDSRANVRTDAQSFNSNDRNQTAAVALDARKRRHVPDEEELAQPEQ